MDIVSSIENHFLAIGEGISTPYYLCTVTNIGVPGVEIQRVGLRSHSSAGVEIPFELANSEERRALARGDSQVWEKDLKELQASLSGSGNLQVVAVATDTVGDQYVQNTSKSLLIPLRDLVMSFQCTTRGFTIDSSPLPWALRPATFKKRHETAYSASHPNPIPRCFP